MRLLKVVRHNDTTLAAQAVSFTELQQVVVYENGYSILPLHFKILPIFSATATVCRNLLADRQAVTTKMYLFPPQIQTKANAKNNSQLTAHVLAPGLPK